MKNAIQKLHKLGQSVWYDNIQRRLLENGELARMVQNGDIRGVTSNPTIFNNAIASSNDYDAALKPMAWSGWGNEEIFWQLAVEDIRAAADLFLPLYQQSNAADGYVSLEVNPYMAHDTSATVEEAKRLWQWVNRPNLMIKIPATLEGIPAIRQAIAMGINVNVTLIFSLERYAKVIDAYFSGLEDRLSAGLPLNMIASVASFFVSRLDTKVDKALQNIVDGGGALATKAEHLLGKAAIANTRLAYALFEEQFAAERFQKLKSQGARVQRPLWASTSTKNPAYRDVIYVEELIAPDTVNTMPPQTLDAFRDHGEAVFTLQGKEKESREVLAALESLGIHIDQVTQELEAEGVKSFSDAFSALLSTIEKRCAEAKAELGPLAARIPERISALDKAQMAKRLFDKDPTLWTEHVSAHEEIRNRLGWLLAPQKSLNDLPDIEAFVNQYQRNGFSKAVVLGMGGSSLAPEVFASTFGVQHANGMTGLEVSILDSTDPGQVHEISQKLDLQKTLFVVSSKSGTTSEVDALLAYFWNLANQKLGEKAARHFVAITDANTPLEKLALERNFAHIFRADATVGGRYSALIHFGLVPAALLGIDVYRLLERARWMAAQCAPDVPTARNPGLVLGAVLGEAALCGKDKLTILADPELASFGSWLEQLLAESSGKDGKGIIPIDLEPVAGDSHYAQDRMFVYLKKGGASQKVVEQIRGQGHPLLVFELGDLYDLGAEFYRWEMATAVACAIIGVNAFDQPQVQDNKTRTMQKIADYKNTGRLDEGQPAWEDDDCRVYGELFTNTQVNSLSHAVEQFLKQARHGDYVAINAYLPRSDQMIALLQSVRSKISQRTGLATTLGFGPRFLHSTGQLHKGGADNGMFIQITSEPAIDLEIPGKGLTFGILERAQALGDFESLAARGRRVMRIHLKRNPQEILKSI
ncbi:MAG: bifunctional transaldolase/phosoglucose isomerase [Anaerolineae bacterium]|nr:bifunctional transaldolase/phosoglucose isomerase [Anaerolineae bacterium]